VRRLLALIAVTLVLLTGSQRVGAQSAERITDYRTTIAIQKDGSLEITEVIAYDFGSNERHGIFRDIPTRFKFDEKHDRVYPLTLVSVTADPPSTPTDTKVSTVENATRIRIGDPDTTVTGQHTYVITYDVKGALNGFPDHDELFWNAIGTDFSVPIEHGSAIVTAPADITAVTCFAGPQGSSLPCSSSNVDGSTARFTQDGLGPFSGLTVVVALPKGTVPTPAPILDERLTFQTGFDPAPGKIATGAVIGIAGIVALVMVLRRGRDRRFVGSATDQAFGNATGDEEAVPLRGRTSGPVEFEPPDGIRPGQLGTLIDEQANLLDVTATIIDLAVRGFILIQEVPGEGHRHNTDYRLTDLGKGRAELRPYEVLLLDSLFETGSVVELSDLKYKFSAKLTKLRNALYDDSIDKGWFSRRPDHVRLLWRGIGFAVLVVGGFLTFVAFGLHWGLAAIPVPIIGLLLVIFAGKMPRRTPKGTAMYSRIEGFKQIFDMGQGVREQFAERQNIFSEYLPFAIVYGCTKKWAEAFEGLDAQVTQSTSTWYSASHPFTALAFASSIDDFSTTATGTLYASTPSSSGGSGFGGGGFSGGGGGGGGGGSW
jgi:uncharacterized membrane protein YgcG